MKGHIRQLAFTLALVFLVAMTGGVLAEATAPIEVEYAGLGYEDEYGRLVLPGASFYAFHVPAEGNKYISIVFRASKAGTYNVQIVTPDRKIIAYSGLEMGIGPWVLNAFESERVAELMEGEYVVYVDNVELWRFNLFYAWEEDEGRDYLQPRKDVYVRRAGAAYSFDGGDKTFSEKKFAKSMDGFDDEELNADRFYVMLEIVNDTETSTKVRRKVENKLSQKVLVEDTDPISIGGSDSILSAIPVDLNDIGGEYVIYLDDEPVFSFDLANADGSWG